MSEQRSDGDGARVVQALEEAISLVWFTVCIVLSTYMRMNDAVLYSI